MHRFRARPGRLLALAVAGAAFLVAISSGVAMAAEDQQLNVDQLLGAIEQLQQSPVVEDVCLKCHANISDTDNYSSEIIFTHGNHIAMQCSACHPRFPHRTEVTTVKPTMKGCFDCHGVRHGPKGELATGKCEDCHKTSRSQLRPAFHAWDWAQKPHVEPANKEFNSRCAMCHAPDSCTECHDRLGIRWAPAKWEFDSKGGCMSCHASPQLTKASIGGNKSFQVTGVEISAHQDLTCQQCHIDYRYDDKASPSQLWRLNASVACADCHRNASTGNKKRDQQLSAPVELYERSQHAVAIEEGRLESAACSSCHGGHFIYRLNNPDGSPIPIAKAKMHNAADVTCGDCKKHGKDYETYDDYYHGKAYKAGAPDSPACWQCHNSHDIQRAANTKSSVNPSNVGETCGQEGCHQGSSEKFGTDAADLIHKKAAAQEKNPLLQFIARITGR